MEYRLSLGLATFIIILISIILYALNYVHIWLDNFFARQNSKNAKKKIQKEQIDCSKCNANIVRAKDGSNGRPYRFNSANTMTLSDTDKKYTISNYDNTKQTPEINSNVGSADNVQEQTESSTDTQTDTQNKWQESEDDATPSEDDATPSEDASSSVNLGADDYTENGTVYQFLRSENGVYPTCDSLNKKDSGKNKCDPDNDRSSNGKKGRYEYDPSSGNYYMCAWDGSVCSRGPMINSGSDSASNVADSSSVVATGDCRRGSYSGCSSTFPAEEYPTKEKQNRPQKNGTWTPYYWNELSKDVQEAGFDDNGWEYGGPNGSDWYAKNGKVLSTKHQMCTGTKESGTGCEWSKLQPGGSMAGECTKRYGRYRYKNPHGQEIQVPIKCIVKNNKCVPDLENGVCVRDDVDKNSRKMFPY